MDVNQETGVELSGDAAAAALSAAFAKLPAPKPHERITLRDVRVFQGANHRWHLRVVYQRRPGNVVEDITFVMPVAWAKVLRARLAVVD